MPEGHRQRDPSAFAAVRGLGMGGQQRTPPIRDRTGGAGSRSAVAVVDDDRQFVAVAMQGDHVLRIMARILQGLRDLRMIG